MQPALATDLDIGITHSNYGMLSSSEAKHLPIAAKSPALEVISVG
ncbi:MAG: hypothetical protein ACKO38_18065 [Planctomycetota bacterium]